MDAVVCHDFGEANVEAVPRPEPGPDEALIAVSRVQLSVTECQLYEGRRLSAYETVSDRIRSGDGRLFGHEFCGEVVEVGGAVRAIDVGDRVYAPAKLTCGTCGYCRAGYENLCANKETIGMKRPGALAEYLAMPAAALRRLPDAATDVEGAAMQPLNSALVCGIDGGVEAGDVVAVIGCGVMGAGVGQFARDRGAREVVAVDVDPRNLDLAEGFGLTPLDGREADPAEAVRTLTDGVGADVVFAAVGGDQSHGSEGDDPLAVAHRTTRAAGTLVQVGLIIGEIALEPRAYRSKSIRWVNPRLGVARTGPNTDTGDLAPRLVADGRVSIAEFVTHEVYGLESFEEAVEMTMNKPEHDALGPAQIVV